MKIKQWDRKKWENFWYYNKVPILSCIAAIALILFVVFDISSVKPVVLSCVLFDGSCQNNQYASDFAAYAGIDLEETDILFKDNISLGGSENAQDSGLSYLSVRMLAGEVDLAVLNPEDFAMLSSSYFMDLRDCLDENLLGKLEDKLYYLNDPTSGAIPIGIKMDACSYFLESFYYNGYECILGICQNASNFETINQFLEFLLI